MNTYSIIMTFLAQRDLVDIWTYVAKNDGRKKADTLSKILEDKCESLSQFPHRGHTLRKIENLELFDLHEIYSKPYRIIYEIINNTVIIYGILDTRRNLKELLPERLSLIALELI